VYESDEDNHETKAVEAFNDGQNISVHADHSWIDSIGMGSRNHGWHLASDELPALSNFDRTAVLYTMGCNSGDFYESDCFAEHWLVKHPEKVGVGYIGNAGTGWFVSGCCHCLSGVYMVAFTKSLFLEDRRHLGDVLIDHKNDNPPGSDNYMLYIFYELNLLGDPEMPLWFDTPKNMTVTYYPQIPVGIHDYKVRVKDGSTGIEGARVCLSKGEEVYAVGTTAHNGQVDLTITPLTDGVMDVTVTAYDYLPYTGTCTVSGQPDVTVALSPDSTVIPRGDSLGYTVTVTNHASIPVNLEYWTDIILWNGKPYQKNPVFGPKLRKLKSGQTGQAHILHPIPGNAPLRTYTCCGQIGVHPDFVWDQDCFEFTVVEE
jgi:hypothetical protein